ncbi:ankyrin repeat domain-containing protein [Parvularcula marina]|uniref:ankyrin repeat domain-containing protein n=1 Tax=Parvularcula marina TaxID=2292771 RepID=UPI0035195826
MTAEALLPVTGAVLAETAILAGVILLLDRILPHRMVRERHDMALVAILIVPILFVLPFFLPGEANVLPVIEGALPQPVMETVAAVPRTEVTPVITEAMPVTSSGPDLSGFVLPGMMLLWGLGAAALLFRLISEMISVSALIRRARPLSQPVAASLSRPARVMVSGEVEGPMLAGFFRPVIILPEDMVADESLRPVLEHEIAHLARQDNLLEVTIRTISALFWWNLPIHALRPLIAREREKLCDAYAAERAGGGEAMADALLKVASRQILGRSPALALPAIRRKEMLADRLRLLTRENVSGRPRLLLGTALVPVVFFACAAAGPKLGPAADMAEDEKPTEEMTFSASAIDPAELYFAARRGRTEEVERLLAMGADPNAASYGDGTPLIGAVRSGDHGILTRLLAAGADPNRAARGDGSPLISAAKNGRYAMAIALLDAGAKPDMGVRGDGNALIVAAHRGDLKMVDILLEYDANIEAAQIGDGNALIAAVQAGKINMVHALLEKGANVDAFVIADETPLIAAAQRGDLDITKLLIEYGADVSLTVPVPVLTDPSRQGFRSPISEAERYGHEGVAEYLRAHGAEHRPPA